MTDLRTAVFTVLEGWTLPSKARKILETAYYAQPEPQVCCGNYDKCTEPCTPKGRWQGQQEAQAKSTMFTDWLHD